MEARFDLVLPPHQAPRMQPLELPYTPASFSDLPVQANHQDQTC